MDSQYYWVGFFRFNSGLLMNLFSKQKLISILLAIFFLILISATSFYALKNIEKDLKSNIKDSLQTVLLSVQKAQLTLINQRILTTQSFSNSPLIISLTQQLLVFHNKNENIYNSQSLKQLRVRINPLLKTFGDHGFFVIAPDRISIASMRNENINKINLIHTQKPALLDRAFLGESVFIPTIESDVPLKLGVEKAITMFITVPIKNLKGKVIAVFALRVDPDKYFSNILEIGQIGESGETYAFDNKGFLLTASRFESQLIKTKRLALGEHGELSLRVSDPGGNLLTGYSPKTSINDFPLTTMAQSAIAGNSSFDMQGYRDYRGVKVFGSWLWDKRLGIGLATEIDIEEALQPFYRTRYAFITAILLTIIFAVFMLRVVIKTQAESKRRALKAQEELECKVSERTKELSNAKDELSNAIKELELLAITDGLTGLANRRQFDNQLNIEWQRAIRDGNPISLVFFDIDFFKQYNDSYGHLLGDNCLQKISSMLLEANVTKRLGDLICRYGGEEFIVLLPASDIHYAKIVAETIREHVEMLCIPHNKTQLKDTAYVTVSVGYAVEDNLKSSKASSLIQKADEALYQAKSSGRNKTCQYRARPKIVSSNIRKIKHN